MEVHQEATIKEVLEVAKQQDKVVNVVLSNGKDYKGSVVQAGVHHVRLALKDQMSFFDAMIRLEHISAVEVQVRT